MAVFKPPVVGAKLTATVQVFAVATERLAPALHVPAFGPVVTKEKELSPVKLTPPGGMIRLAIPLFLIVMVLILVGETGNVLITTPLKGNAPVVNPVNTGVGIIDTVDLGAPPCATLVLQVPGIAPGTGQKLNCSIFHKMSIPSVFLGTAGVIGVGAAGSARSVTTTLPSALAVNAYSVDGPE